MKKYALSALVFDFDIYPRGSVDSQHASEIAAAIEAGAAMPPLIIDQKSKRVVDGFHRGRSYRKLYGEEYQVNCVEKSYKNDAAMFIDAMKYNASHGRALTQHDKAHCLLIAERFSIAPEIVSESLNITPTRIGELRAHRIGSSGGRPLALKRTMQHMAGKELTAGQAGANERSSGMNQLFYVNQIIDLIENDLLDLANEELMRGLDRLATLLDNLRKKRAA